MAMNNDVNIEEKLTCRFKTDMMNLTNSDPSTQKLKNFHFKQVLSDQYVSILS